MSEDQLRPPQEQDRQPGIEGEMTPKPVSIRPDYQGADKLKGKVALVTGGDSGIGRAVAVHFAAEGADVFVAYLNEHEDAEETKRLVEELGTAVRALRGRPRLRRRRHRGGRGRASRSWAGWTSW